MEGVSDLTFASPERRSLLVPVVLALAALALAAGLAMHFFPVGTVNAEHVHTALLPTTTVYKAQSIVVGQNEVAKTLFIASTVRVQNGMRVPVYVDNVFLTLTDASGAELTEKGLSRQDIATAEQSFPRLKPLLTGPMLQDAAIDPRKSAEGTILFSLSVPQELWDARKSAVVKVDLYHQGSVYVTIPKA